MKVAFINLIRDPMEHSISQWYFNQTGTAFTRDLRQNFTDLVSMYMFYYVSIL